MRFGLAFAGTLLVFSACVSSGSRSKDDASIGGREADCGAGESGEPTIVTTDGGQVEPPSALARRTVEDVSAALKSDDREAVVRNMDFPVELRTPRCNVRLADSEDLLKRFRLVFTKRVVAAITEGQLTEPPGYPGWSMLRYGVVWIDRGGRIKKITTDSAADIPGAECFDRAFVPRPPNLPEKWFASSLMRTRGNRSARDAWREYGESQIVMGNHASRWSVGKDRRGERNCGKAAFGYFFEQTESSTSYFGIRRGLDHAYFGSICGEIVEFMSWRRASVFVDGIIVVFEPRGADNVVQSAVHGSCGASAICRNGMPCVGHGEEGTYVAHCEDDFPPQP